MIKILKCTFSESNSRLRSDNVNNVNKVKSKKYNKVYNN